jgi:hypothetical protein
VDDLVAFVRRCLDEDERVALAAIQEHSDPSGRWALGGDSDDNVRPADPTGNDWVAVGPWDGGLGDATAAHIARWDPARVLAEVEAKRERLLWIEGELADDDTQETVQWLAQLEAQPYVGQDGWREEWQLSAPA